jgi:hypothetical protein
MQTRSFSSVPTRAIHTATQISMIMKTFSIAIRVGTWHTSCYFSCSLDICNILKEVWLACAFCLEDSKSHMDHRRGLFCDTWNDLRQFFCHHKKIRYWAIHFMSVKGKWVIFVLWSINYYHFYSVDLILIVVSTRMLRFGIAL